MQGILCKSIQYAMKGLLNDISQYIDDIYSPSINLNQRSLFLAELQLNKTNTEQTKTSCLEINTKVIGSDVHTSVYDKCNDTGLSHG